jgi:hypothetical protein
MLRHEGELAGTARPGRVRHRPAQGFPDLVWQQPREQTLDAGDGAGAGEGAPAKSRSSPHVAIDDTSRLAYLGVIATAHAGENRQSCAGFLRRAAKF